MSIDPESCIVTRGTQFHLFTTKNMGATGATKSCGNSEEMRPKSPGGHRLDKARLRISGAYRALPRKHSRLTGGISWCVSSSQKGELAPGRHLKMSRLDPQGFESLRIERFAASIVFVDILPQVSF